MKLVTSTTYAVAIETKTIRSFLVEAFSTDEAVEVALQYANGEADGLPVLELGESTEDGAIFVNDMPLR